MEKQRRHFTAQQKVAILREHLVEKTPVSEICRKHRIQPTLFYQWQKTFFENGTAAFERPSHPRVSSSDQKKITKLEEKIQRKDEVMAELLSEHILLKKNLGEI